MGAWSRRRWCGLSSLLALWVFVGCGETKQDVIGRQRLAASSMRDTLKFLASKLPAKGSADASHVAGELLPPLYYDEPGDGGNTEIIMEEQLLDPDTEPRFDLRLSRNLLRCLAWTGPKSPLAESAKSSRAGKIEREFEQAWNWHYLAVIRVTDFVPPQLVSESNFVGGQAQLEVYLLRKSDGELLGAFSATARSAENVEYAYRSTDVKTERAEAFVHSSVWKDARKQVVAGLRSISHGEIRLRDAE